MEPWPRNVASLSTQSVWNEQGPSIANKDDLPPTIAGLVGHPFGQWKTNVAVPNIPGLPPLQIVDQGANQFDIHTEEHGQPIHTTIKIAHGEDQIHTGHTLLLGMPTPIRDGSDNKDRTRHQIMRVVDMNQLWLVTEFHNYPQQKSAGQTDVPPFSVKAYDQYRPMELYNAEGDLVTLDVGKEPVLYFEYNNRLRWKLDANPVHMMANPETGLPAKLHELPTNEQGPKQVPLIHGPTTATALEALHAIMQLNPLGFLDTGADNPRHDNLRPYATLTLTTAGTQIVNDVYNMPMYEGSHLYLVFSFQPGLEHRHVGNYDKHFFCKDNPELWHPKFDHRRDNMSYKEAIKRSWYYARLQVTPWAGVHEPQQWEHFDKVFRPYPSFPVAIIKLGRVQVTNSKHQVPLQSDMPYPAHTKRKYFGLDAPSNIGHYSKANWGANPSALPGADLKRLEPLKLCVAPLEWKPHWGFL